MPTVDLDRSCRHGPDCDACGRRRGDDILDIDDSEEGPAPAARLPAQRGAILRVHGDAVFQLRV
jgi:hypothetical protein